MDLKAKIIIIVGFCIIISTSLVVILVKMFDKIEDQLLQKCRIEALIGAQTARTMMELMIHARLLTADQILSTRYREIEGTNPKKYHTEYDVLFDEYMQKFEDEFLKDEDVVFSILIDKNGYVPTHNSKYSLPAERDYQKNLLYSRSKRNFADKPEIREVMRYRGEGTFKYPYHRDTGEVMWNIASPITLQGKFWGIYLIGISLNRIDIIKNQMIIIIVTVMIICLSFTLLVILAVIPKKYLTPVPAEKGADPNS